MVMNEFNKGELMESEKNGSNYVLKKGDPMKQKKPNYLLKKVPQWWLGEKKGRCRLNQRGPCGGLAIKNNVD